MEADRTSPQRRRAARFGVTSLLVGLVMLPVAVLCVGAGSVVLSHRTMARQAEAVEREVVQLSALAKLHNALDSQELIVAFDMRMAELDTTREQASSFLGIDLAAQADWARAQTLTSISALAADSPVSADTAERLYAELDSGVMTPADAAPRIGEMASAAENALVLDLDRLELDAGHGPLVAALKSLRVVTLLFHAANPQVIDLSMVWFPTPGDTPQSQAAALARLSTEKAAFDAGEARLHELGVATVSDSLRRIRSDLRVQAFDQAVAGAAQGPPIMEVGSRVDIDKVAAAFRGHVILEDLLRELVTTATAAVRDEARQLAASERSRFVTWSLGAAVLALASIGIAVRLSHSISKPLKDLSRYAHAINEGDLDFKPTPRRTHGPRETRMAFDVFSDLVTNLQLVDAKANALAHCDFDDPVLHEPLPGRLGRSLESSVALLSGSIVERDELQTHLAHEATHDSLTGVFNRPAAISGLQAAINRAARTGALTAVLFVDLNEFKAVNDRHGHEVGVEVLRQVAARMAVGLRRGDFVARLGGDEFIVVAEGVADVADAASLARRLIERFTEPIAVGTLQINVEVAIGIALSIDGPEDPLRLLARADAAMYRAKYHERSAIEIFDADLQQQMIEREDIESALAAALANPGGGGLQLHYQPVLDAMSGDMVGAEALIRWDRPGHGRLAPDSFIPIAEASALIIDVDRWVLSEAADQLVAWSTDAALADLRVSVNISGRHLLGGQLPAHIQAVIDESGINPHRLSIEITETVLLADLAVAATELHAVRSLGVNVAIDDFGTGYTSLAHLEKLPIDTIKIDRSFISQLNLRRGSSLVRMVTDLGHAIDINIVAEGVETNQEMAALQAMGADQLQGFLLSRPLEPAALAAWANEHRAARRQSSATRG
jgi:diguanylate cyclase (GGDEF)-like protein